MHLRHHPVFLAIATLAFTCSIARADVPVITEGDVVAVTMSEDGDPTAFALTLNGTDPDMDPLTWTVASQGSNGTASVTGNDTSAEIGYTPNTDFNGTDSFGIQLADGNGGTDLILVNVTIEAVPDPPVLAAIGNRTIGEGEALLFAVVATDPDGDAAVLSVENLPEGAEFDEAEGVFSWTPGFEEAGLYEDIVFTAVDGADDAVSVSETIAILVNDTNRPPVLETIGNVEVAEEGTLTITLSATDPDGDNITYFMNNLPDGAEFDTDTATLTYAPVLGDEGDYAVIAGAQDDGEPVQSDTEAFVISVTPLDPSAVLEESAEMLLENFADTDTDDDSLLTYAEALVLLPELLESRFNAMDADDDELLSELELLDIATLSDIALEEVAQTLVDGFDSADANEDGELTEDEASDFLSGLTVLQFDAMDADDDGVLTEAEISTVANARLVRLEDLAEQLLADLDTFDTDDDGSLDRSEAEAAIDGLVLADFEDLDLDTDDFITEAELTTTATLGDADLESAAEILEEFFFQADSNGDDFLSREEVEVGISSLTLRDFQELDGDSDGLLSYEEVVAAAAVGDAELETAAEALADGFDDADGDDDGFLSQAEAETVLPDLTLDGLREVTKGFWSKGITTFLPTLTTQTNEELLRSFKILNQLLEDEYLAQSIPGFHLEGPYISPEPGFRGVHNPEWIREPNWEEFLGWFEASGQRILEVTVAPEIEGTMGFIEKCIELGIVVALGHTGALAPDINQAVAIGATVSTHLGNGCANTIHRHHNPLWPQLADPRLTASIIVDGFHLTREEVRTFLNAKGVANTVLVSDLTRLAGMPPGRYEDFGRELVMTPEGAIKFPEEDVLAGASFLITRGIENIIDFTGCTLEDAVNMASQNPARMLGLEDRGEIAVGKRADLIFFTFDEGQFEVVKTVVGGKVVYNQSEQELN